MLLDTGCSYSCCSLPWFELFASKLHSTTGESVHLSDFDKCDKFVFANGDICSPQYSARIPLCFGAFKEYIDIAVFDFVGFSNPLLLGYPDMQRFGLDIDTSNSTVSSRLCGLNQFPLVRCGKNMCLPVCFCTESGFENVFAASNVDPKNAILRFHRQRGHMFPDKLHKLLVAAGQQYDLKFVTEVVRQCPDCKASQLAPTKPKSGGFIVESFNKVCFADLIEIKLPTRSILVCHFLDAFARYSFGEIIPNKEAGTTLSVFAKYGALVGSYPVILLTDNGTEFNNKLWNDFCAFHDVQKKTTRVYYPQGNSIIERRHGYIKGLVEFVSLELSRIGTYKSDIILAETIRIVNSSPNSATGFSPNYLFNFIQPRIGVYSENDNPSQLNDPSTYSSFVRDRMVVRQKVQEAAFGSQCRVQFQKSLHGRFPNKKFNLGDIVYYWNEETKTNTGPFKIIGIDGTLYNLRQGNETTWKYAFELTDRLQDRSAEPPLLQVDDQPDMFADVFDTANSVFCVFQSSDISSKLVLGLHEKHGHCPIDFLQMILLDSYSMHVPTDILLTILQKCPSCSSNLLLLESVDTRPSILVTCSQCGESVISRSYLSHLVDECPVSLPSQKEVKSEPSINDSIEEFFVQCPNCSIYVLESEMQTHQELFCKAETNFALRTHSEISESFFVENREGILQARRNEIQSWISNDVYEVVDRNSVPIGSNVVTSRCVETLKLQTDGTRKPKCRIVARGFEDLQKENLTVESPTATKLALRMFVQFAVDNGFTPKHIDIKTAFLQGKVFSDNENRTVYVKPPRVILEILDRPKSTELWKMKKSVYGFVDAPYRWYLSIRDRLLELGMVRSALDHAVFTFSYKNTTIGLICVHVDDILYCGTDLFFRLVIENLGKTFQFGSESIQDFTYCGIQLSKIENGISLSQEKYIESLKEIVVPRIRSQNDLLSNTEYSEFRTVLGNLSWLAVTTRPDIAFAVNSLSRIQNTPKISDLRFLNKIVRGVKYRKMLSLKYRRLPTKEISVLADSSFNPSIQGFLVLFSEIDNNSDCLYNASIIDWSSRKISRVARSTTAAECLAVCNAVDNSIFVQSLWYEFTGELLPIRVYNDSSNFIHLCYNGKQPDEKRLALELSYLRECLSEHIVSKVSYLSTDWLLADALTKSQTQKTFARLLEFLDSGRLYLPT